MWLDQFTGSWNDTLVLVHGWAEPGPFWKKANHCNSDFISAEPGRFAKADLDGLRKVNFITMWCWRFLTVDVSFNVSESRADWPQVFFLHSLALMCSTLLARVCLLLFLARRCPTRWQRSSCTKQFRSWGCRWIQSWPFWSMGYDSSGVSVHSGLFETMDDQRNWTSLSH